MSLQDKYQILSALSEGETQSVRARQFDSGQTVLIHYLVTGQTPPGEPDLAFLIFKFLRGASAEEGRHLLDMGEDEGRIFVVTTDAEQCLDLRKWLQSVIGVQGDVGAGPGEGSPLESGHFDFTRTFTREALRQFTRMLTNSHTAASERSSSSPPAKSSPPPSKLADSGSHDFTVFWDKYYPARGGAGSEAKSEAPTPAPKPDESAEAPGKGVEHDRAQAPAAGGAKGAEAPVSASAAAVKRPISIDEVDISRPVPPAAKPASDPSTRIPKMLAELLTEHPGSPPPTPAPSPMAEVKEPSGMAVTDQAARRPAPKGFEVVFQSDKPRSRPTLSGVYDASSGVATPAAGPPPPEPPPLGPEKPVPSADEMKSPILAELVKGPAAKAAGPAVGSPKAPVEPKAVAPLRPPSPPVPLPVPPIVVNESERPTRPVSASPAPPSVPPSLSRAPAAEVKAPPIPPPPTPAVAGGTQVFVAPRVPPPKSVPPSPPAPSPVAPSPVSVPSSRVPPGEYTRMIENVRAVAGPLPPLGEPERAAAGPRPDAARVVPAPLSAQASVLNLPAPQPAGYDRPSQRQPAVYIVTDTPAYAAGRKRKVWVPILILSTLFLMTLGVLLFFSLKH